MGLYMHPYRDFGRLQLELHRAIRLVVDTGLASQALDPRAGDQICRRQLADAPGGVVKAIERYIVFPGQARRPT